MTWHLLMKTLTVKDGERALLTRDGRFERVLEPGRHRLFDLRGQLTAEIFNVVRTEFPAERYAVLKAARPDLAAELFEAVETKANEIAIVSLDGRPVHLMTPWQARVYWKVATSVDVERIDVARDPRVTARHLRDDRAQASYHRDGGGGREPRGRSALCRGPAAGAACARPARLLDRRPQDRGQAPRSASPGGRDHRAGNADQGSHRAACDPDGIPPDRRSRARGRGRARRGCVAVPAGAVRHP